MHGDSHCQGGLVGTPFSVSSMRAGPNAGIGPRSPQRPSQSGSRIDLARSLPCVKLHLLRSRSGTFRVGLATIVLLGLIAGTLCWKWVGTEPRGRPDPGIANSRDLSQNGEGLKNSFPGIERLLDDARTPVRLEQLERATRLLTQYLANAHAGQADVAKLLLREIALAGSASDAAVFAGNPAEDQLMTGSSECIAMDIDDFELPDCLERLEDGSIRVAGHRVSPFHVLDALHGSKLNLTSEAIIHPEKPRP
jgi:hypothetical protein